MLIPQRDYAVYIVTNYTKTVLYTGVTNNLEQRITEHYIQRGESSSFTGRYNAFYLIYYEFSDYVLNAIAREANKRLEPKKKRGFNNEV